MLVVDTSVAVKWVISETGAEVEAGSDLALALLSRGLIAPDCILGEFANALFKKVRRNEIGKEQVRAALDILPALVTLVPIAALIPDAVELAFALDHPVHDCLFLALAMRRGIDVVTSDLRFVKRCRERNPDYPILALDEA